MAILGYYKQYQEEESCKLNFKAVRDKEGVIRKKCSGTEYYWKRDRWSYECKKCHFRTSLRSGTVVESSKLSLRYWFIAIAPPDGDLEELLRQGDAAATGPQVL